jgi:hypothetical protein
MEFLINARSGSKNPSTLTSTTADCSNGHGAVVAARRIVRQVWIHEIMRYLRFVWIPSCVQVVTSMIC